MNPIHARGSKFKTGNGMSNLPRIMCVIGTRPDAIKSAPVILELRKYARDVETLIVSTGQHREMLNQVLECFDLKVDLDLAIMKDRQSLSQVTAAAVEGLDAAIKRLKPHYVLLQGDTSSSYTASLAAFYNQIPCGHIEAGLRTRSIDSPFPEEFNRRSITLLASQHFAPTIWAATNLKNERIDANSVFITGNTGIDALKYVAGRNKQNWFCDYAGRIILLTTHRRESWGEKQKQTAQAAIDILQKFPDAHLVVSVHLNPRVREVIMPILNSHPRVTLLEPPAYPEFVKLLERSYLILTDSGGIQEEAPSLGIPVLVLRDETERPEGVKAGVALLVGTKRESIVKAASDLLENNENYKAMSQAINPYGDGQAAARIRYAILKFLGIESESSKMFDYAFAANA